jgi:ATP-dependent Lhr-like helicase
VEVLRRVRRASLAVLRKEIEPVGARALTAFMPSWQGVGRWRSGSGRRDGVERLREVLVPLQGLALPVAAWERDVLSCRTGSYSPAWLDSLCASGEVVWVGAGSLGRDSGRVALYFREDAPLLGAPWGARGEPPAEREHALLRERMTTGPCFFTDLLAELDVPAPTLTRALWDLVWAGEVTNDAWAPLRAPRLTLATQPAPAHFRARAEGLRAGLRFGGPSLRGGRRGTSAQVQGRWSLTSTIFDGEAPPRQRRRALAELLLERYGVLTREQVLAEGVAGGFSTLYGALTELETLGVCRRGYFVEGLGGAQFALPGAVERLRSGRSNPEGSAIVLAAVDPAQPYGATLPWPRRDGRTRRPSRVAGAYVVLVDSEPVLYLERGGRGLLTLVSEPAQARVGTAAGKVPGGGVAAREAVATRGATAARHAAPLRVALGALADAVRAGSVDTVALERVDGEPAIGSEWEPALADVGFRQGPRRLTLRT